MSREVDAVLLALHVESDTFEAILKHWSVNHDGDRGFWEASRGSRSLGAPTFATLMALICDHNETFRSPSPESVDSKVLARPLLILHSKTIEKVFKGCNIERSAKNGDWYGFIRHYKQDSSMSGPTTFVNVMKLCTFAKEDLEKIAKENDA